MNISIAFIVALQFVGSISIAAFDWAQPPVGCPEEVIPTLPDRECLDLSLVANPQKDLPPDLSE